MSDFASRSRQRPSAQALFSYGFRPFFVGAGVYAVVVMVVWLAWLSMRMPDWTMFAGSPFAWHAHEMIFGFAAAAMAGFLLTAVPSWSAAPPLSGSPLVLLFAVWLGGRASMLAAGLLSPAATAAIDVAFLPLLGIFVARQLMEKPAPRNFMLLGILAAIVGANVTYHLAGAGAELGAVRFALMLLALLIAIIGGRVIPTFTRNWLHLNRASGRMPQSFIWLDVASIVSVALLAVLHLMPSLDRATGCIALIAAFANAVRLFLWHGLSTWRAPIVFILHLGYAWVVVGLLLMGGAALTSGLPSIPAEHAFGVGAVATMIMAIMTRASLGHTGRAIVAPKPAVLAYGLLTVAAFLRVFGAQIAPDHHSEMLQFASLAWIGAFGLFVAVYTPILSTPRIGASDAR